MDRARSMGGKRPSFDLKLKAVSLAVTAALAAMAPAAAHAQTVSVDQTNPVVWASGDLTVQSGVSINVSTVTAAVPSVPGATLGTLSNSGVISNTYSSGTGISNPAATIGKLTNDGTILGGYSGINNLGTIGTLSNSGTITGVAGGGVYVGGSLGTLSNSGSIQGGVAGVYITGATGSIGNSGVISDSSTLSGSSVAMGGGVWNQGALGTLTNSGTISGNVHGVNNYTSTSSIGTLDNSGLIKGGLEGIRNEGTISVLTNESHGAISGLAYGVYNNAGTISTLTNGGVISGAVTGIWIDGGGSIGTLTNSGTISGVASAGIHNDGGTISTLTNSGAITESAPLSQSTSQFGAIWNAGSIGTLTNTGTLSGNVHGVFNSGTIDTLNSSGTVTGGSGGVGNRGTIGTLSNSGLISSGTAMGIWNAGTIGTLRNSGTVTGGTAIYNDGTIGTLANSGVIRGSRTSSLSNAGTIGALINSGTITGGNLAIYNYSTGTIGLIVNSGVIAGNIENASSNDLTINGGSGSTFGTLTGFGGTIGTLTNTSSNVVFGSGNLLLNDNVNVGSNTVANSAATLQVNNAVTITGNYSQGSAATLLVGVASGAVTTGSLTADSGYGRLVVSGSATVASGSSITLQKTGSYAFAAGQRYVVIDASSTGTNYSASSLKYSINGYTSVMSGTSVTDSGRSDLVVTVVSATENVPSSGTSTSGTGTGTGASTSTTTTATTTPRAPDLANRPNAASSLGGLLSYTGISPDLLNLYNAATALSQGSSAQATRAGVQLGPVSQASVSSAAAAPTFDVLTVVANRADSLRIGQAYGQSGVSTGESTPDNGVWGQVLGGHAGRGDSTEADGYSANYGGLLFGADKAVSDRWRAGGAFSFTSTAINNTGDSAGDSTRVNAYGLFGYASYTAPKWYANVSAGAVLQHYDTTRVVDFTGFSGTAQGQFSGQQYVAQAEAGYPIALGAYTLTPLTNLTYSYLHQNAYTESGGSGAALSVGAAHASSVTSDLGVKLERGFATGYGVLVPDVRVAWRHEYVHGAQLTSSRFAADASGETTFTTTGASPVSDLAVASAGVTLVRASNLTLTARYELQVAPRYVSQTGSLRLRQLF